MRKRQQQPGKKKGKMGPPRPPKYKINLNPPKKKTNKRSYGAKGGAKPRGRKATPGGRRGTRLINPGW